MYTASSCRESGVSREKRKCRPSRLRTPERVSCQPASSSKPHRRLGIVREGCGNLTAKELPAGERDIEDRRFSRQSEHAVQLRAVDRERERATDPRVDEGRVSKIPGQHPVVRVADVVVGAEPGIAGQRLDLRGRRPPDRVHVTAQQFGDVAAPGREFQHDPVDARPVSHVPGVRLELHHHEGHLADESIRTVPDGVRPEIPALEPGTIERLEEVPRVVDRIVVQGAALSDLVGPLMPVLDRVGRVVHDLDRLASGGGHPHVGVGQEVERERDVMGGDRLAVVPQDVIADSHGPRAEVTRVLPRHGQTRLELPRRTPRDEREEQQELRGIVPEPEVPRVERIRQTQRDVRIREAAPGATGRRERERPAAQPKKLPSIDHARPGARGCCLPAPRDSGLAVTEIIANRGRATAHPRTGRAGLSRGSRVRPLPVSRPRTRRWETETGRAHRAGRSP